MRPCILLAFALLASFFCGCRSVELGSAPAWVVEDAGEAPDESTGIVPSCERERDEPPLDEPKQAAFRECTCSDHRAELQALQFRVAGIEQRESLRPFRETPKSQPSVPKSQPAQRYEGDCAGGVCGPRLAPRVFGGRMFGRR